ncbi:RNA recognition motif 2-domain-containing protein [Phyllosticta citricarpa]|uniref:RNA recognition motif 2-domain-containing protein n=2 Tax=Phyllosticta TaxID=121621 RepID=A0ABR1LV44_9PEZI
MARDTPFSSSSPSSKGQDTTPVTSPIIPFENDVPLNGTALAVQPLVVNTNSVVAHGVPSHLESFSNARLSQRFSTEHGITRYVIVRLHDSYDRIGEHVLQPVVERTVYKKAQRVKIASRIIAFFFDSLSQAEMAVKPTSHEMARELNDLLGPGEFLSIAEWLRLCGPSDPRPIVHPYEGQVVLEITTAQDNLNEESVADAYYAALEFLDEHLGRNQVRAFMRLRDAPGQVFRNDHGHGFRFRLEVDMLRVADDLKKDHEGTMVGTTKWTVTVVDYSPAGMQVVQNTGLVSMRFTRQSTALVPRRARHNDENGANAIALDHIREGVDVRTTVMVRNIPNKMDTYQLEDLLRKLSFGRYDFVYLRIDFRNGFNVGYAFVNFASAMDVVNFCERLVAHGWPGDLGSGKSPALSYATVQGVEALVEKFRNSSVMLELHHCRPRLFHTRETAFRFSEKTGLPFFDEIGKELPFPPANNDAKLQRSRQNAETQGLWPAHTREDQRRARHTTYDRGNPNATVRSVPSRSATQSTAGHSMALTIGTHDRATSAGLSSSSLPHILTPSTGEGLTGSFSLGPAAGVPSTFPSLAFGGNQSGPASGPLARYTTSHMTFGRPSPSGNDLRSATGDPAHKSGRF